MSNSTSYYQSRADYNKYANPARYQPRVVDYNGHSFVVDDKPFFINPFMRIPEEERIRYKEERAAAKAAKAAAKAKAKANHKHDDRKYQPGDKPFFLNPFRRVTSHYQKKKEKKKPAAGTVHPDDAGRDPKLYTCCGGVQGGPHMAVKPADRRRLGVRAKNKGFFDKHNADAALRRNKTEPRDFAYVAGSGEPVVDDHFRWRKRDKVFMFCIQVVTFLLFPNPNGKAARADRELEERMERWGYSKADY